MLDKLTMFGMRTFLAEKIRKMKRRKKSREPDEEKIRKKLERKFRARPAKSKML